jgi:HNH endonuclease
MTTRPTAELRRLVVERASNCCEYCLLHQDFAASTHQVDHVIAEKHGGQTALDNLALSCTVCNRRKGSDISSIDPETGNLVSLFNPRTQQWSDHFKLDGVHIVGLTEIGRTTVEFLQLNAFERLTERDVLMRTGRYPPQRTMR